MGVTSISFYPMLALWRLAHRKGLWKRGFADGEREMAVAKAGRCYGDLTFPLPFRDGLNMSQPVSF